MQVPAPFDYVRATSVDHAVQLLDELGGGSRLLAGGHSLLPMMKLRLTDLDHLIDINDLHAELGYIRVDEDEVRIGAMTRHRELLESAELAAVLPIFADAERVIADPLVRNRGTIGGSLCQADPSEDLSAVCATTGASLVVRGLTGERVVPMSEFHHGPYETAVQDGEILTEVRIPVRPGGSSAYAKVERRAGDWAVASVGAAVWMDGEVLTDAAVGLAALGGTGAVEGVGAAVRGREPGEDLFSEVALLVAQSCSPVTDGRGSAEYKRHLAAELTRRTLRSAVERIHAASRSTPTPQEGR